MGSSPTTASSAARLVLGTAQLGMTYGVGNTAGRPDARIAHDLVAMAWEGGIRYFDTAQAYGDSETVLATCLAAIGAQKEARIVTKLDPDISHTTPEPLELATRKSLTRLGVSRLAALFLHDERHLDDWAIGPGPALAALSAADLIEAGGVSLYSPQRALEALEKPECVAIQIPASVLDRRFEDAGVFARARRRGVRVYVRSIFLQGLLLMDPDKLPLSMQFAREPVATFRKVCRRLGMSPRAAALAYVRERHPDALVLFGAETPQQVRQNLIDWITPAPTGTMGALNAAFAAAVPETVINPSLWPQQGSNRT